MGEKKGIVGHEGGIFEREGLRKDEGRRQHETMRMRRMTYGDEVRT